MPYLFQVKLSTFSYKRLSGIKTPIKFVNFHTELLGHGFEGAPVSVIYFLSPTLCPFLRIVH